MSNHTPGPWSIKRAKVPTDGEYDWAISAQFGGRPYCIAETVGRCASDIRLPAEANARLVAAAPDLLAANEELLILVRRAQQRLCSYLCPEGSDDPQECMNDLLEMFDGPEQRRIEHLARAAIAKTTVSQS